MSCSLTSREGNFTSTLCYKLMLSVPNDQSYELNLLKEELFQIALQVEQRSPTFYAGGFFVVDNTLFYSVIGTILMNIIILIQFDDE